MRGFREFILKEEEEALFEASYALMQSGVDVVKLNEGLDQIILHEKNWAFNPFRTFGNAGAATAGAVAGSAFGPIGTVAGGALGALAGKGIDWLTGKFMGGASVEKIKPAFDNAIQAVSKLQQLLKTTQLPNNPKMAIFKDNMDKIANSFAKFQSLDIGGQIDTHRNQELDTQLSAKGGLGNWLRSFTGKDAGSKAMAWIGDKIKNVPALNQDQGLRRAIAKGVDSLDDWARANPKKSMLLNMAAGVGGAATGALGAYGVQNMLSNPQAKIKPPELPQDGTTDVAQGSNNQPAQPSASPEAQPAQPQAQAQPAAAGQTDDYWAEKQKEYFGRKKAELLQRAKDRLDSGRPYMNQGNVRIPAVSPEAAELGRARSVPLLPN